MQALGMVARFHAVFKETHVKVVNRIFKYLKATLDFGLWYPNRDKFTLIAYIDTYWSRSVDDQKSPSGGAFFLGDSLVSCLSKK